MRLNVQLLPNYFLQDPGIQALVSDLVNMNAELRHYFDNLDTHHDNSESINDETDQYD